MNDSRENTMYQYSSLHDQGYRVQRITMHMECDGLEQLLTVNMPVLHSTTDDGLMLFVEVKGGMHMIGMASKHMLDGINRVTKEGQYESKSVSK